LKSTGCLPVARKTAGRVPRSVWRHGTPVKRNGNFTIEKDFSQANDLSKTHPKRLEELKDLFKEVSHDNLVWPIGAGWWLRIHPEDRIKLPYSEWRFDGSTMRMPEFTAPGLGRQNSHVEIKLTAPQNASGVLYALGGFSGGLTFIHGQGSSGL
jgi:hypothetical protein